MSENNENSTGWLCKRCVFADYKDNVQVGCKVGKIDVFKNMGVEIEEVKDDPSSEDPKEYYFIKDKFCNGWRSDNWLLKNQENPELAFKKENELRYDLILVEDEESGNSDIVRLENVILEIMKFDIKPNKLFFASKLPINLAQTSKLINRHFKKWTISNLDLELKKDEIIDTLVNKIECNYYVYSTLKNPPQNNNINEYHNLICEEQRVIGYYKDKELSLVNRHIHEYFQGGHFGKTLFDKIQEEKPELIYASNSNLPQ